MAKVIIFVPGIMGSEIKLNGDKVWPGSLLQFLHGFSDDDLKRLLDPGCIAGDIVRSFGIVPQYSSLIDFFASCGFREQGNPPNLYVCAYDWRKSNILAADTLAAKIKDVAAAYNGNAEITLITHSMGGLVARYYLESGKFDNAPGFDLVANLYTLATPHLGAPIAVIKALGQDKTIFLSGAQIKVLGSKPEYPSLYELFPQRNQPVIFDSGSKPVYQLVDIFGAAGDAAGLTRANLDAADKFHQSLKAPAPAQNRVRYFFFSGTQKTTTINLTTSRNGAAIHVDKSDRDDAGDGTVPIWSSKFGLYPSEYCGGEHGGIYNDFQLKQTLRRLITPPTALESALEQIPPAIVVTVTQLVLRPGDFSQLDITLMGKTTKLNGVLSMEKAILQDEKLTGYALAGEAQEIRYEGPSFDRLRIQFTAPMEPGIYRAVFRREDGAEGSDQYFVQGRS